MNLKLFFLATLVCLLVLVTVCEHFSVKIPPEVNQPLPNSLLIIGDSVSADVDGGYPGCIRALRPNWSVEVFAYPGKSSEYIKSKIWQDGLDSRLTKYKYVLVMMGINDADSEPSIRASNFFSIYYHVVSIINPMFDFYPMFYFVEYPVPSNIYSPGSAPHLTRCINLELMYKEIGKIAENHNIKLNSIKLEVNPKNFQADNIHMKEAGNVEIAQKIVSIIESNQNQK